MRTGHVAFLDKPSGRSISDRLLPQGRKKAERGTAKPCIKESSPRRLNRRSWGCFIVLSNSDGVFAHEGGAGLEVVH